LQKIKHIEIITNAKVLKIEGEGFCKINSYERFIISHRKKVGVDGVFVDWDNPPATSF